jgi:hypothetical protein
MVPAVQAVQVVTLATPAKSTSVLHVPVQVPTFAAPDVPTYVCLPVAHVAAVQVAEVPAVQAVQLPAKTVAPKVVAEQAVTSVALSAKKYAGLVVAVHTYLSVNPDVVLHATTEVVQPVCAVHALASPVAR